MAKRNTFTGEPLVVTDSLGRQWSIDKAVKAMDRSLRSSIDLAHTFVVAIACVFAFASLPALSEKLAPVSRDVFKCVVAGKTIYTDSPCLGAQKVDVEPTRGLNKSSGREQIGNDVRREQSRELIAGAVRPITGMDAKQLDVQGRRMKLSADSQRECRLLDVDIPNIEKEERSVRGAALADVQARLLRVRQRFKEQGC